MALGFKCFAGANTQKGFVSGFDGVFEGRIRTFYIKGAPGVGKSGLMKRVFQRQSERGHVVSAFYCSSDPDSLDGVVDETLNCALMDATAPHSYDPVLPGARDSLLSLGDFLDERALAEDAAAMQGLQAEIARQFGKAAHLLAAAGAARRAEGVEADAGQLKRVEAELTALLPRGEGREKKGKRFFLSAHTCKGYLDFAEDFAPQITVSVPAPFGGSVDGLMRGVGALAAQKGLETVLFLDPVDAGRAAHLLLPEIPLFITSLPRPARQTYDGVFSRAGEETLFAQATQRARDHLRRAKALHDELEGYYIPRMDFSRLSEVEARVYRTLDELETQR